MPSPAVGHPAAPYSGGASAVGSSARSASTSMSPRMDGAGSLLPMDWPLSRGGGGGGAGAPHPPASPEETVSFSQYAHLQAEKATLEVKLSVTQQKLADAEERESRVAQMATAQRDQQTSVIRTLLSTMQALCPQKELPEDVLSPRRAAIVSGIVKKELMMMITESESEKDLAVTTAEASTAKIDELVVAVNDRDICIATLEEKVTTLQDQVRALRTSPVREERLGLPPPCEDDEDSLLRQWAQGSGGANTTSSRRQPSPPHGTRGPPPPPPTGTSPRPIKTPPMDVPQPVASQGAVEWPPSPRRVHVPAAHNTLDDTLPEEFPPSPRRVMQPEAVEEWPPSPRRVHDPRGVQEEEEGCRPNDWSNVTATPDSAATKDWLLSPQKQPRPAEDGGAAAATGNEWPPSPQRLRSPPRSAAPAAVAAVAAVARPSPGGDWPPSPQRVRGLGPRQDTMPARPSSGGGVEEWPPSPPRSRAVGGGGGGGAVEEWPPSPQRHRSPPPAEQGVKQQGQGVKQQGQGQQEWPPSPPRARSSVRDPMDETVPALRRGGSSFGDGTVPVSGEEWPLGSRRGEKTISPPTPEKDNSKEWPPSPQRARSSTPDVGSVLAPALRSAGSSRREQWPASPRRTPQPAGGQGQGQGPAEVAAAQAVKSPVTPAEADRTATPVEAGRGSVNNSFDDGVAPQKLEWPATSSPVQPRSAANAEVMARNHRSNSTTSSLGSRRRSVGFIDIPENDLSRKHSASDLGAARRAVDLIREPSELTPTAAKMKIHRLEEELRRMRTGEADTEPDTRFGGLDAPLRTRAEAIFNAVDAQCQQDGSVSKEELRRVLRKERLGAQIFFHELDANDSGEIDINEWLNWFGHLQKREAAENMLEWLEQELAAVNGVNSSIGEADAPLDPLIESRATAAFDRILNAASTTRPYVRKAQLTTILTDGHSFMRDLQSAPLSSGELVVKLNEFLTWLHLMQQRGTSASEVMDWVELKLANFDEKQNTTSPARMRDILSPTSVLSAGTTPCDKATEGDTTADDDLVASTPVNPANPAPGYPEGDEALPAADTPEVVPEADAVEPPVCEGGGGPRLAEDLKQRAIDCYHQLDQRGPNTGEIPRGMIFDLLKLDAMTGKMILRDLLALNNGEGDIMMADWMEWFDSMCDGTASPEDMLAFIEQRLLAE